MHLTCEFMRFANIHKHNMINHGTNFGVSPAMDRHCDHIHSSLLSRHATKRLSNALNMHLKQMYMLFIHCQLTKHAKCVQETSCRCNFAQTQTGSQARCCCMQLLTSIATYFVPHGIIRAWDHSMQLLTQLPLVPLLMASVLFGIKACWDLLGDLCHSLQILLTASMLARWHIASPHIF